MEYTIEILKEYRFNAQKYPIMGLIKDGKPFTEVESNFYNIKLECGGLSHWFSRYEVRLSDASIVLTDYKMIPGFDPYAISEDAEVIKLHPSKHRVKQVWNGNTTKRLVVRLNCYGKKTNKQVAELMLLTYGNQKRKGKFIVYKDGNAGNCRLKNLVYTTKRLRTKI